MTRKEHLLTIASEEAVEIALALAQRCSKALRFSLEEVQPEQPHTNAQRVMREFADLAAVMEMLQEEFPAFRVEDEEWYALVRAKRAKVEKYLRYSQECGTLDRGGSHEVPGS